MLQKVSLKINVSLPLFLLFSFESKIKSLRINWKGWLKTRIWSEPSTLRIECVSTGAVYLLHTLNNWWHLNKLQFVALEVKWERNNENERGKTKLNLLKYSLILHTPSVNLFLFYMQIVLSHILSLCNSQFIFCSWIFLSLNIRIGTRTSVPLHIQYQDIHTTHHPPATPIQMGRKRDFEKGKREKLANR